MHNTPPIIKAHYAPVYWEPMPQISERFVSIIVVQPVSVESKAIPTARVVLSLDRLRVMFGRSAKHVFGIMNETADFLTHLLEMGTPIERLQIPFTGFSLGDVRMARGRTIEQMLDGAVRSISSLGAADALYRPTSLSIRRQTQATASFIQRVRREFSVNDQTRRERFRRTLRTRESGVVVTLDYSFKSWVVQVTSLPHLPQQETRLRQEAESKLFELQAIRGELEGNARPILMVNASTLQQPANDETRDRAQAAFNHLKKCVSLAGAEMISASTAIEGAHVLETMH